MSAGARKRGDELQDAHEIVFHEESGQQTTVRVHALDPLKRRSIPRGYAAVHSSIAVPPVPFSRPEFPVNAAEWAKLHPQEQLLAKVVESVWETVPRTTFSLPVGRPAEETLQAASQLDQLFGTLSHWAAAGEVEGGATAGGVQHISQDGSLGLDAGSLVNTLCFARDTQEFVLPAGRTVVLPGSSAFCWADLQHFPLSCLARAAGKQRLIVVDPPWFNRSVRRGKKYTAMTSQQLLSLDVPALADPAGCVLALWVTNDPAVVSFATGTLLPQWGFELLEEWLWLKVAADGQLVSSVTSRHKKPYERLLLARFTDGGLKAHLRRDHDDDDGSEPQKRPAKRRRGRDEDAGQRAETGSAAGESRVPTHVFICPSLRHSMKPPIESFLVEWAEQLLSLPINAAHAEWDEGGLTASLRATELFARETKAGFVSVGNQPLLFQVKDVFLSERAV